MDWLNEVLKEYVPEDKMDSAVSSIKKVFPEHAVPKDQYNKKVQELEVSKSELGTAKEQMEAVNTKLSELSKGGTDVEELNNAFKALENEYSEYKNAEATRTSEIENGLKKDFSLEKALMGSGVDTTVLDLIKKDFDVSSLSLLEDGTLDGFDSQLATVKEKRPNSFASKVVTDPHGKPPAGEPHNSNSNLRAYFGLDN